MGPAQAVPSYVTDRDRTCTEALFGILPAPGGGRNYREKRSGVTLPSAVGRARLAGCAVGPRGFEAYYEMDPDSPTGPRCPHVFQLRYFIGLGPHVPQAIAELTTQWGSGTNPTLGMRRIGTGGHGVAVSYAAGSTSSEKGRLRRTQFGYARGEDLVLGGETQVEDPMCTQSSRNSQDFLRDFPWPLA